LLVEAVAVVAVVTVAVRMAEVDSATLWVTQTTVRAAVANMDGETAAVAREVVCMVGSRVAPKAVRAAVVHVD